MIHLDTNFLIALSQRSPRETALMKRWIQEGREVSVSAVAWAEFLCGPIDDVSSLAELLGRSLAFEAVDASQAATLFNAAGRRARSLPDCMIAAVAIRANAELATADVRNFIRFMEFGLRLVE